jgi:ketosteroid isomerase-like protein
MKSTSEVLDHHLKYFANRDINGVMADHSADAVFFGPEGALRGPDAIRPVFERFFVEFATYHVDCRRRLHEHIGSD